MRVLIEPNDIQGDIKAIASKSDAHRAIICAALADKKTNIYISEMSEDIKATLNCMSAFGAKFSENGKEFTIEPVKKALSDVLIDCNESGSTLRFLLPVAAALGNGARFIGKGRLPNRPIGIIVNLLKEHGISFDSETLPLSMSGKLTPGEFKIEGNVSSQFISGLLFALPLLDKPSKITLLSALESKAYVDMTISVLNKFGAEIKAVEDGFLVQPIERYVSPDNYTVEGDWSNAAFFLVGAALSGNVNMSGLDMGSKQSDTKIVDILKLAGVKVTTKDNILTVTKSDIKPFELDVSQCPDLFPIAAVLACGANGKTTLYNAGRLRIKESDRIVSTQELILGLGGKVLEEEDSLTVFGDGRLSGGMVDSVNDHRIAMSASIASCICEKSVTLNDAQAVNKSYPDFYKDFESLGGKVHVI